VKAHLMFADRDWSPRRELRVGEQDVIDDLDLERLWTAMAQDDETLLEAARGALLDGLVDPDEIRYRQAALTDCIANAGVVRTIHGLAAEAVAAERQVYRGLFSSRGEALVRRSITVLESLAGALRQLREIAERDAAGFRSEAFTAFFETLRRELDDDFFDQVTEHLRALRFRDGVFATASLGKRGQGTGYVLRSPRRGHGILRFLAPTVKRPSFSWTIPARDDAAGHAMAALRDRVLSLVASAVGESTEHVVAFFAAVRSELGFYVACLNLHERLAAKGEPLSMPDPQPSATSVRTARGLFDPCLSLRLDGRAEGNDLDADGKSLIIITGANQGGKSTFLRSLGLAQLMMQAGMFVAAEAFSATVAPRVLTHYRREEDATMTTGKFEEELARMSQLADQLAPGDLLLCNESFAATNEREGSEVAGEVLRALTDTGRTVAFVTHLYELARDLDSRQDGGVLFLRAERGQGRRRTFRIREGRPLATSYAQDLYRQTFRPSGGDGAVWSGLR
jgi:MutS domain V